MVHDPAALAAMHDGSGVAPGLVLSDRYHLVRRLGRGGMGDVWEARHVVIRKALAIKVLTSTHGGEQAAERFLREARIIARIAHPHVVEINDFGRTSTGAPYYAMELLRGETLAQRLRRAGPLRWPEARAIALQIVDALGAAHAAGVVHRDVKPDNVFLVERRGSGDFVKLLDFGIAKSLVTGSNSIALTSAGVVFGTPRYMSPEQLRGDPVDGRSDLYAMGCVLYEMLTGAPPFAGTTPESIVAGHLFDPPRTFVEVAPLLTVAAGVEPVVFRCLQKEVGDRFGDMAALATALAGVGGRRPPVRLAWWMAVAAAVVLMLGAAGMWRWLRTRATGSATTSDLVAPSVIEESPPVMQPVRVDAPVIIAPEMTPPRLAPKAVTGPVFDWTESPPPVVVTDEKIGPRDRAPDRRTRSSPPASATPEVPKRVPTAPVSFEPRDAPPPRQDLLDPFGPAGGQP